MAIRNIDNYKTDRKYMSVPDKDSKMYRHNKKDYAIHFLSNMLYSYTNGSTEIRYKDKNYDTLELYFKGLQGNTSVKEKLLRRDKKSGKFKGRMRDVFDNYDILPEMLDIITAINSRSDYNVNTLAVDGLSKKAKELEMDIAKFIVNDDTKAFLKFMNIKPQTILSPEEIAIYNEADIDVMYETGGIQLPIEIQAVAVCNTSKKASNHKDVEDECTEDFIKWGISAVRPYIDYSDNTVKYRRVDVRNLIIPKSKYRDFRDISKFAEIRWKSLIEIRRECPSLTEDQLRDIIQGAFKYNNAFMEASSELDSYFHYENNIFDDILVPVLDAEWLATDYEVYLSAQAASGGEIFKKVDNGYELTPKQEKKGNKLDKKKYIRKFAAEWVIGSDILLNFDYAKNVKYKGPKGNRIPELGISIVKTGKKSLVARAIPAVDDVNLNLAKLRNAIATLPPAPRMIVYQHALKNIKLNGILQSPRDLVDSFLQEGVLIANGQDEEGNFIFANGGKAVDFLNTNLAEDLTIYSNNIVAAVNRLRQVLGLPEGLDGSAGNPYTGVVQVQLAAQSSSNALYPTLSRIGPLFERTFNLAVHLWQCVSTDEDISIDDVSISEKSYKMLKLTKDFSMADFNIYLTFAPTDEEKQSLLNYIEQMSLASIQSQGQVGYNRAEYFLLYRLIRSNRVNEAAYMIARLDKQKEAIRVQDQQGAIESASKQQQDSARVTAEEARKTLEFETDQVIKRDYAKESMKNLGKAEVDYMNSKGKGESGIPEQTYQEVADNLESNIRPIIEKILAESTQQQNQSQQQIA